MCHREISSIGGATVLHTEGYVFKSLISYMLVLLLFILLLISNAVSIRQDKSISYYNINNFCNTIG